MTPGSPEWRTFVLAELAPRTPELREKQSASPDELTVARRRRILLDALDTPLGEHVHEEAV